MSLGLDRDQKRPRFGIVEKSEAVIDGKRLIGPLHNRLLLGNHPPPD